MRSAFSHPSSPAPSGGSIAAIATAQAPSALGLIRCSGPLCATLANPSPASSPLTSHLSPFSAPLPPRTASLRSYRDLSGTLLDQVVATFYAEGHSFTGEPSLELTCHGNPFILQKILADLLARGFTLAAPGEFTRRAFLSGRLDLTQAEAIASVISAHSDRALKAAHRQLSGELGARLKALADSLLSLIAATEATLSFSEHDEDVPSHLPDAVRFTDLIASLTALRRTHAAHRLTFEGARIVLAGPPNAGKSSLFNALVGHDRALVSPIAGTTRDYLSATLTLGPHLVTLIDTAGLNTDIEIRNSKFEIGHPQTSPAPTQTNASNNAQEVSSGVDSRLSILESRAKDSSRLESLGIQKTRDQLSTADVILFLFDGTQPPPPLPDFLNPALALFIANKSDLPNFSLPTSDSLISKSAASVPSIFDSQFSAPLPVSSATGTGLSELRSALLSRLDTLMPSADTLMVSARHAAALDDCLAQLTLAHALLTGTPNAAASSPAAPQPLPIPNLPSHTSPASGPVSSPPSPLSFPARPPVPCPLHSPPSTFQSPARPDPALIAHHLHSALACLGEILGRFDNENVLDKLFSTFCIGK